MFDTLLQLPLFQGLSQDDFTCILEKVKFDFTKYKAGEVIVHAGHVCDSLIFILKGEVQSLSVSPYAELSLIEFFQAPHVIEPYSLFGMSVSFAATFTARSEVHSVCIPKKYIFSTLFDYEIFRLNYLNILANRAQTLSQRLWIRGESQLDRRIVFFFLTRMERVSGEKIIKIKMQDLALIMNETRASVSKVLNTLQEKGLLILHRGEVVIPDAFQLQHEYAVGSSI
ncbi:transcription regulator, CRP family [gut metagenome]|uniref:Transcription regulator, CRP family n=1 Tax=gut metagenome TaxID=749906 RepID=J9D0R5_9ZZZZ